MAKASKKKKADPPVVVKRKRGPHISGQRITDADIEKALRLTGGFITYAAQQLKCAHSNISTRISKSEKLKEVLEEIRESFLDLTEAKLIQKIREGDLGAICFYLKCHGKKRGYIEVHRGHISIVDNTVDTKIKPGMSANDAASLYAQMIENG